MNPSAGGQAVGSNPPAEIPETANQDFTKGDSMTVTIKSERIGNYLIEISQDKYEKAYKVSKIRLWDESSGTLEKESYYPDIKKATARYNKLKREA